jgi:hypothetical protein
MSFRLTAESLTKDTLEQAAVTQGGLLGTYTNMEFKALEAIKLEAWSFEWTPFSMDPKVGRIKMRPLCQKSVKLLDKGRALHLIQRHPWLKLHRAIGFIKVIKKHQSGMNKKVQDFLLKYWKEESLRKLSTNKKGFIGWVKTNSSSNLNSKEIDAVLKLINKTYVVMSKSGKPNNRINKVVAEV